MIEFEINQEAVQLATKRVNEDNKRKASLQVCINGLVCPICVKDLEKHIDGGMNTTYVCTSDACDFVWPQPAKKLRLHIKKNKPNKSITWR